MPLRLLLLLLLVSCGSGLWAQSALTGRVFEGYSETLVAGVNVYNRSTGARIKGNLDGSFSIAANEGDTVIFSRVGFHPDTLKVSFEHLLTRYDVNLKPEEVMLKNVTVTNSYSADSLNRRNYYADIYKPQPGITGGNRPSSGFGVVLSPLSFFSSKAKEKRKLKKKLKEEEEQIFIDYSFSPAWVANVTGLKGDSLALFMYRYRPSYKFCRDRSRADMLTYISDSLRVFRKPDKKD